MTALLICALVSAGSGIVVGFWLGWQRATAAYFDMWRVTLAAAANNYPKQSTEEPK